VRRCDSEAHHHRDREDVHVILTADQLARWLIRLTQSFIEISIDFDRRLVSLLLLGHLFLEIGDMPLFVRLKRLVRGRTLLWLRHC